LENIRSDIAAWVSSIKVTQSNSEESQKFDLAFEEINRARLMVEEMGFSKDGECFEEECFKEVNNLCDFLQDPTKSFNIEQRKINTYKLFDALLEIAFVTKDRNAINLLPKIRIDVARKCYLLLSHQSMIIENELIKMESVFADNKDLKCLPYCVGMIYKQGWRRMPSHAPNAKRCLTIAADRDYKPLLAFKKQSAEYQLMLEAQQSNGHFFKSASVFSTFPKDLVVHIARLRFEATVAQQKK